MKLEFQAFPKIPRLSREIVVTEKIDGTNAQIAIYPRSEITDVTGALYANPEWIVYAGSRSRWLLPTLSPAGKLIDVDNYGFAKWVGENVEELLKLGPGHHFGEWWGAGIQRKYGLQKKYFSLFNVGRWGHLPGKEIPPDCCCVVPTLYEGVFSEAAIQSALDYLRDSGSVAAPGFMDPEGVVIYHTAAKQLFKKLIKNDEIRKEQA